MNKIKALGISTLLILSLCSSNSFANSTEEIKTYKLTETIPIEQTNSYRNNISKELEIDNIKYELDTIKETENKITVTQEKEVQEDKIVKSNDKYEILKLFENEKKFEEKGYKGILKLQYNDIDVKVKDSYTEQYKVYLEKRYNNISSNELNDIPKVIKEEGITYYLTNPIWKISQVKTVEGQDVPNKYDGIMQYEGIKEKTVIQDYLATARYKGTLEKEVVDTITFDITYKEIPQESNYIPVIATTGAGIVIFSGIIVFRRKNIYIYNYQKNQWKLVKKIHISKNQKMIDITPLTWESNKYKILLKKQVFNKLKDENITVKYFDKHFVYQVKEKEFEILV